MGLIEIILVLLLVLLVAQLFLSFIPGLDPRIVSIVLLIIVLVYFFGGGTPHGRFWH